MLCKVLHEPVKSLDLSHGERVDTLNAESRSMKIAPDQWDQKAASLEEENCSGKSRQRSRGENKRSVLKVERQANSRGINLFDEHPWV